MGGTDGLTTARALGNLVHAHRLVAPAFTVPHTRRTQPAFPLRRLRVALLRVTVADDPAAAAAWRQARGARRMPVLDAGAPGGGAVREPARGADVHVLVTQRLPGCAPVQH